MARVDADTLYKQHRVFGGINAYKLINYVSFCMGMLMIIGISWLMIVTVGMLLFDRPVGASTLNGHCMLYVCFAWVIIQMFNVWEAWLKRRYQRVASVMNALENANG